MAVANECLVWYFAKNKINFGRRNPSDCAMKKETQKTIKFDVRAFAKPLMFALGVVYLGFHALHGERGIYALLRESHRQTVLQKEYQTTKAERVALERRVSHLRNESLDLDLLDEQNRRMLGEVGPGEMVILNSEM